MAYLDIHSQILEAGAKLIAVSKYRTDEEILNLYALGQRVFAENRVQDMVEKQARFPKDIQWHMIGNLQTNKVKLITPFIQCIHSVAKASLAEVIQKEASKLNIHIACLLEVHISSDTTKHGFSISEILDFFESGEAHAYPNIQFNGLMGMATLTENTDLIRAEFKALKQLQTQIQNQFSLPNFKEVSMGMSSDYTIALEEGATMVRIGSALFTA